VDALDPKAEVGTPEDRWAKSSLQRPFSSAFSLSVLLCWSNVYAWYFDEITQLV